MPARFVVFGNRLLRHCHRRERLCSYCRAAAAPVRLAGLLVLLSLAACAFVKPKPALRIPEGQFHAEVKTVCMEHVKSGVSDKELHGRISTFEDLLARKLRDSGFSVVPPEKTTELCEKMARSDGGAYDPYSGYRDEAKFEAETQHCLRELHRQLGCDAMLTPRIALVLAPWENGDAEWDGASEDIAGGFMAMGRVPALSLWVSLLNMHGDEIYFGTGGIQVVTKYKSLGFLREKFQTIPIESVLSDPQANYAAVERSLEPLLSKPAATTHPTAPPSSPNR